MSREVRDEVVGCAWVGLACCLWFYAGFGSGYRHGAQDALAWVLEMLEERSR